MRELGNSQGNRIVEVSVPFDSDLLENFAPDLGPIGITPAQTVEAESGKSSVRIGGKNYRKVDKILTYKRELLPAESWLDPVVEGFSKLEAVYVSPGGKGGTAHP